MGSEHDHAACVAALGQVVKGLRRFVDAVAARDEFVQLQPPRAVQAQQAGKVVPRPRAAVSCCR
jgi:hypothetical protein